MQYKTKRRPSSSSTELNRMWEKMPIHSTDGGASIFFAKTPDFGQLCSVVCLLDRSNQSVGGSINQPYSSNQQDRGSVGDTNVLKCRELIFTESSILASPSRQEEDRIFVIVTKNLWLSGKFQERCQKMGLQYCKPMRVIPAVFQACFSYTLKAKLAPLWNKVGEYYVQGRDFITATGLLGAISLETNVTDGEICFAIKPTTIKLPHSVLQDFGVCPPIIAQFLCNPHYIISQHLMDDTWCHVLPSMKKGIVESIMHSLPASSPFKSYADLRRYWKNTYGYRLPENGDNIVYLNVYFPALGNIPFTYPEFCIRKQSMRHIPRVDCTPVLQAFLADIGRKVPQVCDCPLEVTRRPQYTAITMNSASGQIGSSNLSSLTLVSKPSTVAQRIPTRSLVPIASAQSKESNNNHPGCVGQISPYRPLCGQTSIMSNTGYTIKMTPSFPSSSYTRQSYGGYSSNKPSDSVIQSRGVHQQQIATQHGQVQQGTNTLSSSHQTTTVTPAGHHNHQHQPSLQMMPYSSDNNRAVPCVPVVSPIQTSHNLHGGQSGYASPYTEIPAPSPSPNAAGGTSQGWQHPGEITASVRVASRSAVDQNHTMFSLAVHLRNQTPQNIGDASSQQCSSSTAPSFHVEDTRMSSVVCNEADISCSTQFQNGFPSNQNRAVNRVMDHSVPATSSWIMPVPTSSSCPSSFKPFVPIFNPKRAKTFTPTASQQAPAGPKIKPSFKTHKPKPIPPSTFLSHLAQTTSGAAIPSRLPPRSPSPSDLIICEDVIPPTQLQEQRHPQPHSSTLQQEKRYPSSLPSSSTDSMPIGKTPAFMAGRTSNFKPLAQNIVHQAAATTTTSDGPATLKKRKSKDAGNDGEPKKSKPRSKPKVQENINVQLMAQNDQLSKVNNATLLMWLKVKGVAVTTKDKKSDLVAKVMNLINSTAKEA